jgi:hypothetical protein
LYFSFYFSDAPHLVQSFNSPFILNDTKLYFSLRGTSLVISPLQATGKHFYVFQDGDISRVSANASRQFALPPPFPLQ